MATRPVFVTRNKAPFADVCSPEFTWSPGFAVCQKQKNITALHAAFGRRFPDKKVLEISSKSLQEDGVRLSAFNLTIFVPSLDRRIPVECAYQGSKVFAAGGPYTDLYSATPREAKRDERLTSSGALTGFCFEGREMPVIPKSIFYNWLYINALIENPELSQPLLMYDGFTDIEFNPQSSISCQAQAAAIFVSLHRLGLIDECRDFDSFAKLFR